MPKLFISYRRDDSAANAHRIDSELRKYFRRDELFIDIDTLQPGTDFAQEITSSIKQCDVFLAVIGQRWVTPRLHELNDFVRLEVTTALDTDMLVIPVLVDAAKMPPPEKLPEPLQQLATRQAIEIGYKTFTIDVKELVRFIRTGLKERAKRRKAKQKGSVVTAKVRSSKQLIAVFGGTAFIIGCLGMVAAFKLSEKIEDQIGKTGQFGAVSLSDAIALHMSKQNIVGINQELSKTLASDDVAYIVVEDRSGNVFSGPLKHQVKLHGTASPASTGWTVAEYKRQPIYESQAKILDGKQGTVRVGMWKNTIDKEIDSYFFGIGFSVAALVALGTASFFFILRQIHRPLAKLSDWTDDVSRGRLDTPPLQMSGSYEYDAIAAAAERMRASLKAVMIQLSKT
jgi:HAMP domain-containing protein